MLLNCDVSHTSTMNFESHKIAAGCNRVTSLSALHTALSLALPMVCGSPTGTTSETFTPGLNGKYTPYPPTQDLPTCGLPYDPSVQIGPSFFRESAITSSLVLHVQACGALGDVFSVAWGSVKMAGFRTLLCMGESLRCAHTTCYF